MYGEAPTARTQTAVENPRPLQRKLESPRLAYSLVKSSRNAAQQPRINRCPGSALPIYLYTPRIAPAPPRDLNPPRRTPCRKAFVPIQCLVLWRFPFSQRVALSQGPVSASSRPTLLRPTLANRRIARVRTSAAIGYCCYLMRRGVHLHFFSFADCEDGGSVCRGMD